MASVTGSMFLALIGATLVYVFDGPAWACVMTWVILYPLLLGMTRNRA